VLLYPTVYNEDSDEMLLTKIIFAYYGVGKREKAKETTTGFVGSLASVSVENTAAYMCKKLTPEWSDHAKSRRWSYMNGMPR